MRGVWLVIAIGLIGCTPTPKREMRQPVTEELRSPPEGTYLTPPDVTRDEPALQPKQTGPGGGPGMGGMGAPGGPGASPGMSPTTKR